MPQSLLTPERVSELFRTCLFADGEDQINHVAVYGITINVGFHPDRLKACSNHIQVLLKELPDQFMKSKGQGGSFLNLCMDRYDNQWTGMHKVMQELVLLGMGIGVVECLVPKELWSTLPGGMPYYVIDDAKLNELQQ